MKLCLRFILITGSIFWVSSCAQKQEKQAETLPTPVQPAIQSAPDSIAIKSSWAVNKIARQGLEAGGYKVLSFSIDSLSYSMVTMKDFYLNRKAKIEKERETYRSINEQLKKKGILVNETRIKEDSLKTSKALSTLDKLIEQPTTHEKLIRVSYRLMAQTNAASYHTAYTKFLHAKDYTEVSIKFPDVNR